MKQLINKATTNPKLITTKAAVTSIIALNPETFSLGSTIQ